VPPKEDVLPRNAPGALKQPSMVSGPSGQRKCQAPLEKKPHYEAATHAMF